MRSREYREGGKTVALPITYVKWTFLQASLFTSIAQSAERQSMDWWISSSNPDSNNHFFLNHLYYFSTWKCFSLFLLFFYLEILLLYVKMAVLYENVMKQIFFETLKVLLCIEKILFFDEIKLDKKNESDYNWFRHALWVVTNYQNIH